MKEAINPEMEDEAPRFPVRDPSTTQVAQAAERARILFEVEAASFLAQWIHDYLELKIKEHGVANPRTLQVLRGKAAECRADAYSTIHAVFDSIRWAHRDESFRINYVMSSESCMPVEIEHCMRRAMAAIESTIQKYSLGYSADEWRKLTYPRERHYYAYRVDWSPALRERWQEYNGAAREYVNLKSKLISMG